jgi:cell division protein FtsQ
MWDRPQTLNAVADALLAVATLLAVYAAVVFVIHLPLFPLREVRVTGMPVHVTAEQIEAVVKRELKGNFFTLNLIATRGAFERLPWVRKADVRRQWPDRLDVTLEEHIPIARWGNLGLVNAQGEVFEAAFPGKLPLFIGPPGSAKEIAIQYEYFRRSLAAIDRVPAQVQVSQRGAWQLRLEDGPMLELGREQIEVRLAKFIAAYERTIGRLARRIDYVDLRYANGFAVRIHELNFDKPQSKGRKNAA